MVDNNIDENLLLRPNINVNNLSGNDTNYEDYQEKAFKEAVSTQ